MALAVLTTVGAGCTGASSGAPREPVAPHGAAALRNPDGTVGPVVALGDSITAGTPVLTEKPTGQASPASWYTQALALEPRLVAGYNAGLPGDLTTGMLARFGRDVAAHDPRVVVILGGTNDVHAHTTEQVIGTLGRLADLSREAGAVPVLATIPPRTDADRYAERVLDLNAAIRALGRSTGTTVIDFHAAVADDAGGWRPGFSGDGVHPSQAGARAMAEVAVATLLEG